MAELDTSTPKKSLGRRVWSVVRWIAPAGLLAYLIHGAATRGDSQWLYNAADRWPLLVAAVLAVLAASLLACVRWRLLVRGLGMRLSLLEAFRLGMLGELLNFVALGSVGGDVVKLAHLMKANPEKAPRAATTVFMDRLIGLFSLCLLASGGILAFGLWRSGPSQELRWACLMMLAATAAGVLIVAAIASPWAPRAALARWAGGLPKIAGFHFGGVLQQLFEALDDYVACRERLAGAVGMSLLIHLLLASSVFLLGTALVERPPSFGTHLVIMPLTTATGVLPLPANALGAYEYVLDQLYDFFSPSPIAGRGLIVALAFRTATLTAVSTGALGVAICTWVLGRRRETPAIELAVDGPSDSSHPPQPIRNAQ